MLNSYEILLQKQKPTSRNSSLPPSQDPNREKRAKSAESGKKPGGQIGHVGKTLTPVDKPDEIISVPVERSALPLGSYKKSWYCQTPSR